MNGIIERPSFQLLDRLAEVFKELPVEMFDPAGRIQGTREPWNAVHHQAETDFTRTRGFLGPLAFSSFLS
jgi:hypothetical protein